MRNLQLVEKLEFSILAFFSRNSQGQTLKITLIVRLLIPKRKLFRCIPLLLFFHNHPVKIPRHELGHCIPLKWHNLTITISRIYKNYKNKRTNTAFLPFLRRRRAPIIPFTYSESMMFFENGDKPTMKRVINGTGKYRKRSPR